MLMEFDAENNADFKTIPNQLNVYSNGQHTKNSSIFSRSAFSRMK